MEDPVSTLALQIVQLASKPDVAVSDLAALAERDAGFAVRLLAVVNSPVHGFSRRVVNVTQASSLLGARGIQNIALGLCVAGMTPLGPVGELLMALNLRRACAARRIAELAKLPSPADHFAVGLLLEMGLLMHARDQVERVGPLARTPSSGRLVRERAAGFSPHPSAGATLVRKWHLPEEIALALEHHHDPTPFEAPLAKVAWIAERVSAVFEGGEPASLRSTALGALSKLKIGRDDAEKLLTDLPTRVQEAASAFGRSVGQNPPLEKVMADANARLLDLNNQYQELVRTMEQLLLDKEALVVQLRESNERLAELAATDGLTGLLNRRAFMDAAARDLARARRNSLSLSVVMFDVDHFKKVNDTHGHQVGDEVLRGVARSAKATVRDGDVIGRYGGEEFAILLPGTPVETAATVADRVRLALAALSFAGVGGTFRATASFGVAVLRSDDDSIEKVMGRADAALYEAKHAGRNRVSVSS